MPDEKLGNKDKIQILLAEYSSLRSEINARLSNIFQIVAIAAAALAAIFGGPMSVSNSMGLATQIFLIFCGCVILSSIWRTSHDFYKAAIRVRNIETEINHRAEEKLLLWENEMGGLSITRWLLIPFLWILRLKR